MKARRQTLSVLTAVFAINFMDRQILAILAEPIKRDLALSDAQLGLLYGFAFAILFCAAGIPLARLADRTNRARIVVLSLALFSAMTAACGLAANYWQLMLARIGVAIGEGGTNPPSQSMISDLYGLHERSTAMALFSLGPHLGIVLGFLVGGLVAQAHGWRAAFAVAAAIGLVLAGLSMRLLREPARKATADAAAPTVQAAIRALDQYRSTRHLFMATAVWSIAVYAIVGWLASFLIRSHGVSTAAAGVLLALILGIVGGIGTAAGGLLADRLGRRDPAWRLRVVALAGLASAPGWTVVFVDPHFGRMLPLLFVAGALLGFYLGPTLAMVQSLAAPAIRATAAAIIIFVANVVGLGLGPLIVGLASDFLQPAFGADSLSLALLIVPPLFLWAAFHYYVAGNNIAADLDAAARTQADVLLQKCR